jgi:hypothetical protein
MRRRHIRAYLSIIRSDWDLPFRIAPSAFVATSEPSSPSTPTSEPADPRSSFAAEPTRPSTPTSGPILPGRS